MTQHGSNPDRPRGRRARPGSDWSGYDAGPQGEREFPELQPIRPRETRGRHASSPGTPDIQRGPSQPPQGYQPPQEFPPQGFQQAQPDQAAPQYGQYDGPRQTAGRHSAPPQPPSPPQQPAASRQPASSRRARPAAQRGGRPDTASGWDDDADSDDPMMAFSERWDRRGRETSGERRKRWWVLGAGGVVAVGIAVAIYFLTAGGGSGTNTGIGSLVTTFLPGELQQVPNACTAVPSSALSQDLPGPRQTAAPPLNTGTQQSQCSWTLDNPPTYRELEVSFNAYSPSSLASGDGSATFAAEDAFAEDQTVKAKPGPKSGQSPAAIASIGGLGSSAFSATQHDSVNGAIVDVATVYVRYHNVIIEVVLNGVDHSDTGKQYGPVSESTLLSQAKSVAQQVTQKITG